MYRQGACLKKDIKIISRTIVLELNRIQMFPNHSHCQTAYKANISFLNGATILD